MIGRVKCVLCLDNSKEYVFKLPEVNASVAIVLLQGSCNFSFTGKDASSFVQFMNIKAHKTASLIMSLVSKRVKHANKGDVLEVSVPGLYMYGSFKNYSMLQED